MMKAEFVLFVFLLFLLCLGMLSLVFVDERRQVFGVISEALSRSTSKREARRAELDLVINADSLLATPIPSAQSATATTTATVTVMAPQIVMARIAGVAAINSDGTNRQDLIKLWCGPRKPLTLQPEPLNRYDANAIGVWIETRDSKGRGKLVQLGYLEKDCAAEIGPGITAGHPVSASVHAVMGGTQDKPNVGVKVRIEIYPRLEPSQSYFARSVPQVSSVILCPYCSEEILPTAKKCKHCGEFLDESSREIDVPQIVIRTSGSSRSGSLIGLHHQRKRWSRLVAGILSFLFPGLGQLYKGHVFIGLLWFLCVTAGYVAFIIPGVVLHALCVLGAMMGDPFR
jgi:hypothetical protein